MRDDTRRRLERLLWAERLKKAGLGLGVTALLGAVIAYQNYDLKVTDAQVGGTVTAIDPLVSKPNASGDGETVHVKLDDGRAVTVLALKSRHIKNGDHLEVTEHRHATGRVTHTLK